MDRRVHRDRKVFKEIRECKGPKVPWDLKVLRARKDLLGPPMPGH